MINNRMYVFNRGEDAPRAVALHPAILGEYKAVEKFSEVLDHVVALRLAVDEEVEANLLLEADDTLDLLLEEVFVLSLGDLALGELGASLANLLCLLWNERLAIRHE
jgi:hypothetical protein